MTIDTVGSTENGFVKVIFCVLFPLILTASLTCFSGHKKDPGIPNLFPFKEEILKQAEEKKRKVRI